jgi:hypothetical protein
MLDVCFISLPSPIFQLLSFDQQSIREKEFRDGPLIHIKPPRPAVEDQSAREKKVQKHCRCREKDFSPQPILCAELLDWSRKQMLRFNQCVTVLRLYPSAQRLAVVVIDE